MCIYRYIDTYIHTYTYTYIYVYACVKVYNPSLRGELIRDGSIDTSGVRVNPP